MKLPTSWNKTDTKIANDYAGEKVATVKESNKKALMSVQTADRMGRFGGVATGLTICKIEAELGEMIPTFDVPGVGLRRWSTIASWPGTLYLAFAPNPGVIGQTLGLAAFAVTARGDLGVEEA